MSELDDLVRRLELLLPEKQPDPMVVPSMGTVTQVSPLRVMLDTDAAPVDVTPDSLISSAMLRGGERVWVNRSGQRLVVIGVVGGESAAATVNGMDMNTITASGHYFGYTMTNSALAVGSISAFEVINYSPDWIVQKQYGIGSDTWDNSWIRTRYLGTTWSPWKKVNQPSVTAGRGGMVFNTAAQTYYVGQMAIVGYTAAPLFSWGDTSWRLLPNDSSAVFVPSGTYRVDVCFYFGLTGDSHATSFGGVVRHTGGYIRPEYYGLGVPNNRMLPRITGGAGLSNTIYNTLTLPSSLAITSVSTQFMIERIGD